MTSEKIFYGILSFLFAVVAVVAVKLTNEDGYGLLFGIMSLLAVVRALDVDKWFQ